MRINPFMRIFSLATIALLTTAEALARAGGGGGFGGGGGGGGGFSGGGGGFSGGGGGSISLDSPAKIAVFILTFIIFGVIAVLGKKRRGVTINRTIQFGHGRRHEINVDLVTNKLLSIDPDFSTEAFMARLNAAFLKIQNSWCSMDLEPMRPFVSDGIYERFTLQLDEMRATGWRDQIVDSWTNDGIDRRRGR